MNLFLVNMSNILSSFKANNVGEIRTAFIPLIGLIAIVPQACLNLSQHGEIKVAFVVAVNGQTLSMLFSINLSWKELECKSAAYHCQIVKKGKQLANLMHPICKQRK